MCLHKLDFTNNEDDVIKTTQILWLMLYFIRLHFERDNSK
jgi:hypothetical protein